jgi:hypothetical protein
MEQQVQIVSDGLEQICLDWVALRRELALPGGALTEEQQQIYLKAKRELWLAKYDPQKLERIRKGV